MSGMKFTGTESTFPYFEALREYLERYGKPWRCTVTRDHLPVRVRGTR
jgi:hypothetical protein